MCLIKQFLKWLSFEKWHWGFTTSFDSSDLKELSRRNENSWTSATILVFTENMYTSTKKIILLNMWQHGVNFIALIHVFISFEFVKRWSAIFDNVTTRYEIRMCSKVKGKIHRADPFFMARHDFAIRPKKTRSKAKFCILTECLKNLTAQCNCDQTMLKNSY